MTFLFKIQDTASVKPEDLQLKPLYEPERVPFTFETIGWKILAVILFIAILGLAYHFIKKYRKNAYRREAIEKLNGAQSVPEILIILKMVAIQTFGREEAGPLYGNAWLKFLDDSVKEPLFVPYKATIEEVIYKNGKATPEIQQQIMSNSKKWIKNHAGKF